MEGKLYLLSTYLVVHPLHVCSENPKIPPVLHELQDAVGFWKEIPTYTSLQPRQKGTHAAVGQFFGGPVQSSKVQKLVL